jgi:hypothetical protein
MGDNLMQDLYKATQELETERELLLLLIVNEMTEQEKKNVFRLLEVQLEIGKRL